MKRFIHFVFAIIRSWLLILFSTVGIIIEIISYRDCNDLFNIISGIITGLIVALLLMIYDKYRHSIISTLYLKRTITKMLDDAEKAIANNNLSTDLLQQYHEEMAILSERIIYRKDFKSLMILYNELISKTKETDKHKDDTMNKIAALREQLL